MGPGSGPVVGARPHEQRGPSRFPPRGVGGKDGAGGNGSSGGSCRRKGPAPRLSRDLAAAAGSGTASPGRGMGPTLWGSWGSCPGLGFVPSSQGVAVRSQCRWWRKEELEMPRTVGRRWENAAGKWGRGNRAGKWGEEMRKGKGGKGNREGKKGKRKRGRETGQGKWRREVGKEPPSHPAKARTPGQEDGGRAVAASPSHNSLWPHCGDTNARDASPLLK